MAEIGKRELKHLADLARIELHEREEEKLVKDLEKILEYFEELKEVNVEGVAPMNGGTSQTDVFREDVTERTDDTGKGKDQFSDVERGYLKVPPVFE